MIAYVSSHFKTLIRSSHLFKFWISQIVNKLSLFQNVYQPIWIVLPSMLLRNSLPKGSSGVCKDCTLLINYYCLVMTAGKRSAFLERTSTSLSTLHIKEFQNLRSLDKKGLQLLTSLQVLSISNCPRLK